MPKTIILGVACLCLSSAAGAKMVPSTGLSAFFAGGDHTLYQAGGFVSMYFPASKMSCSAQLLGGTLKYGDGQTTNRVDLNSSFTIHLVRGKDVSFSPFLAFKYQSFETELDFSAYGTGLGGMLGFPPLTVSAAVLRTKGGELDNEVIFIPAASVRIAAKKAPLGLILGYRSEIAESSSLHGGYANAYIIVGR